jgi:18S rRNA (guanine1575-N7)-methyltransferase
MDIGQGWKFRPGVFDGVISISTIQWLCVASRKNDNPFKRCCRFFQSLYECLRIGGRAVLQFYPDGKHQMEMITTAAMKAGFSGGLIVDYPNSAKAKKYYLVLEAGVRRNLAIVEVEGRTEEMEEEGEAGGEGEIRVQKEKEQKKDSVQKGKKKIVKRREIVIKKKDRLRRRGQTPRPDTKYTGRKRKPKF